MALSRLTSLSLAAVGSVLIAAIFTATPELGRAGKGGKGGGGGPTSGVMPVSAHFEAMAAQIQADGPLIDASLDPDGGWSNLTEIGNYTFQIGTRGKRAKEGVRTLTLYLDQPVGGGPIGPNLDFKIVWMAFNREQCIAPDGSNAFGDCPADQWFNRFNDPAEYNSDARPGLRDMVCGEEINVSLTLRGEDVTGTDQFLSCNESTSHNYDDVYPDIEFGRAACVHDATDGACDQWVIYSKDRNGEGSGVSCFAEVDEKGGAIHGVFDMDFRIDLCGENGTCAVDPMDVDLATPAYLCR